MRPKIGRPPSAAPRLALVLPEAPAVENPPARRGYWIIGVLALCAIGITLLFWPRTLKHSAEIPPPPELTQETFAIKTPEGSLTGRMARLEGSKAAALSGSIDNADRERLLSILSKD